MSTENPNGKLHLPSLSIQGFRGITNLSIPRLAPVTLITGINNTGKTSILEAVRLFTEEATPEVIRELLQFREENAEAISTDQDSLNDVPFLVSALFHGFPRLYENPEPIVFSRYDNSRQMQIQIRWFRETYDADGNTRLIHDEPLSFEEPDSVPALVVQTDGRKRIYPIDRIDRLASARRSYYRSDLRQMSRFVNASGAERTAMLGPLWDNISSTPRERYVIEALRIIDPDISAVSMVGVQSLRTSRTAVVWSDKFSRRVPLRSFGEGMNRLFGIILSLVNVSGGILLVDEFDNGMHYTVQVQAWRLVFNLARELDVQVLATTHSLDCVAGFRQAAAEEEVVDGLMVRIDRLGSRMRSVEYTEEDLLVAMSQRIEVR